MWFCYILRCINKGHENLTYNGSTNNIIRRLRQHNGELKGGAKATKGKKWEVYAILTGFIDHKNALSCEWRIKHPTGARKRPAKYCGVNGRILGLNEVLVLDKWTTKCTAKNAHCNFKLFVTFDVSELVNLEIVPKNIEIFKVNKMQSVFFKGVEDNIY